MTIRYAVQSRKRHGQQEWHGIVQAAVDEHTGPENAEHEQVLTTGEPIAPTIRPHGMAHAEQVLN